MADGLPPCGKLSLATYRARVEEITSALAEAPTRDVNVLAALALSRIGDVSRAESWHSV